MAYIVQASSTTVIDAQLPKLSLDKIVKTSNVAKLLDQKTLDAIGRQVVEYYNVDKQSRSQWEQRNEQAIKLALQVVETKSFPWTNCSNVKFPLLTIAALQFLARISILTKGRKLVKLEALGSDLDGKKSAQAVRLSDHMSMQFTDEDTAWVDDDEKTKLATSILGCGFKKTLYDPVSGVQTTEYVPAMNFVVDYYCKSLKTANRATHLLSMNHNKIQERVRRGLFLEMALDAPIGNSSANLMRQEADNIEGLTKPANSEEYEILEQHCWLDLDGDDYEEPYIVFVRKDTQQVLRIVARFFDQGDVHRVNDNEVKQMEQELQALKTAPDSDMKEQSRLEKEMTKLEKAADNFIVRINAIKYFDKYTFIPSPDGGFYGLGFGALLGPMNESVNTLVNQLIDSGTMSNSGGGFLGRGVKVKGGKSSFDPFEWKPVDSTGDDLRKNIFPLPIREPSNVLFQLLGMLVGYSEKISGATDIMTGVNPGQNTPAETSRNTVEQGMMLFSGIYARMYRSFREELHTRFENNRLFIKSSPLYFDLCEGPNAILAPTDYSTNRFRIYPMADASSASSSQRKEKAALLMQVANSTPGFNRYLVTKAFLETHEFENIDQLYPDPAGPNAIPQAPNPKVEIEKAKLAQDAKEHQNQMQLDTALAQSTVQLNTAKAQELAAKATKEMADAQGVDTGHQIAMLEAQIGAAKVHQDGLLSQLKTLQVDNASKRQHIMDQKEHHRKTAEGLHKAIEGQQSHELAESQAAKPEQPAPLAQG